MKRIESPQILNRIFELLQKELGVELYRVHPKHVNSLVLKILISVVRLH